MAVKMWESARGGEAIAQAAAAVAAVKATALTFGTSSSETSHTTSRVGALASSASALAFYALGPPDFLELNGPSRPSSASSSSSSGSGSSSTGRRRGSSKGSSKPKASEKDGGKRDNEEVPVVSTAEAAAAASSFSATASTAAAAAASAAAAVVFPRSVEGGTCFAAAATIIVTTKARTLTRTTADSCSTTQLSSNSGSASSSRKRRMGRTKMEVLGQAAAAPRIFLHSAEGRGRQRQRQEGEGSEGTPLALTFNINGAFDSVLASGGSRSQVGGGGGGGGGGDMAVPSFLAGGGVVAAWPANQMSLGGRIIGNFATKPSPLYFLLPSKDVSALSDSPASSPVSPLPVVTLACNAHRSHLSPLRTVGSGGSGAWHHSELRALEAAQLPAPPPLLAMSPAVQLAIIDDDATQRIFGVGSASGAATVKTPLFAIACKNNDSDSADGNNDSSWFCATAVAPALLRLGRTQQMTVSFWCRPLAVAGSDSSPLSETQMVVSSQRSYRNNDPHLSTTFCVDIVPLTHYERYLSYDEDDKEEENDNDDGKKKRSLLRITEAWGSNISVRWKPSCRVHCEIRPTRLCMRTRWRQRRKERVLPSKLRVVVVLV